MLNSNEPDVREWLAGSRRARIEASIGSTGAIWRGGMGESRRAARNLRHSPPSVPLRYVGLTCRSRAAHSPLTCRSCAAHVLVADLARLTRFGRLRLLRLLRLLDQIGSFFPQILAKLWTVRPNLRDLVQIFPVFGEIRPNLARLFPTSPNVCPSFTASRRIWPTFPNIGEFRQVLLPQSVNFCSTLGKGFRNCADLGQTNNILTELGHAGT